jgi:hypothetical protein
MFENFRRSLSRAGMYWSQPARVDDMCKNMWAGRRGDFARRKFRAPAQKRQVTASCPPAATRLQPYFFQFIYFYLFIYFGVVRKFRDGLGILGEWMYSTPIF